MDAIIATHSRDRKVAAWLEDTAEALAEIGEFDLAIDWARQAAWFDLGHQAAKASDYWCKLLAEHESGLWQELAKRYEKIDPLAVLPIHTQIMLADLEDADAGSYRSAARRDAQARVRHPRSRRGGGADRQPARDPSTPSPPAA